MNNLVVTLATVAVTAAVSFASGGVPADAGGVGVWPGGRPWGLVQPVPGIAELTPTGSPRINPGYS
jgi:hypothetical protein